MLKLLGVLLVWGGCTLCGARACAALGRRVRTLEEIGQGLEVMEREIALNATALPELLEQMEQKESGTGGALFCRCRAELVKGNSFADSWTSALDSSCLSRRDKQLLSGLSGLLGRYDAAGQVQALSRLHADWDEHIAVMRRQAGNLGRVYGVLGMTAGGFVSLLLV